MNEEALDFTESRGGEEEGWRWPGERKMRGGREKAREEGRAEGVMVREVGWEGEDKVKEAVG